jgi:hypothetical protein
MNDSISTHSHLEIESEVIVPFKNLASNFHRWRCSRAGILRESIESFSQFLNQALTDTDQVLFR